MRFIGMNFLLFVSIMITFVSTKTKACSVLYYIDSQTGNIYVANNEDYYYDLKPYIKIERGSKDEYARLWYGWDDFAQGGVNEAGLFFDAAVTPEQEIPKSYYQPKGNLGDEILARCKTVEEAIAFVDRKKLRLTILILCLGIALEMLL